MPDNMHGTPTVANVRGRDVVSACRASAPSTCDRVDTNLLVRGRK